MAFMASGEDPDYGPYATHIRKALRNMITNQNPKTGYMTGYGHGSMYHHGFAMLALSEAYGAVNEELLWKGSETPANRRRTIGEALELAVRCALTAQEKNPWGAWRYSPGSQDADTTVAGTVLMGILGARNAGIEVPNEAINKALTFFSNLYDARWQCLLPTDEQPRRWSHSDSHRNTRLRNWQEEGHPRIQIRLRVHQA